MARRDRHRGRRRRGLHLRLIIPPPLVGSRRELVPGTCWYASRHPGGGWRAYPTDGQRLAVADRHRAEHQPPMLVVLPQGDLVCLQQPLDDEGGGLTVYGHLPRVTLAERIGVAGPNRWQGWLRAGVLATT
jgi:hypothetical protein